MFQIPNFGFGAREEAKNDKEVEKKRRLDYLKNGLIRIQKRQLAELSFEKLYVTTFEIVRDGKFIVLYHAVQDIIYNHVQINSDDILRELSANSLSTLIKEWNDHIDSAKMIGGVLLFLEHAYIERENLVNIYDMALTIFRKEIIRNNEIRKHIQNILLEMVHTERTGNSINHNQFKEVINMLLSLSALEENNKIEYEEVFETEFLLQSEMFYKQESQNMLSDNSIGAISYLKNYDVRCNQEKERIARLLHNSTEKAILNILEKCLIKDHLTKIVDLSEGLKYMLETACKKELGMIYQWFKDYEREDEIVNMIIKIYKEYGLSIVENQDVLDKEHSKIIEDIVSLKDKYHEYLISCFQNNEKLKKNIEDNFYLFFNQNPRMAEYLSSFIHETLRKKQKNITDEELDEKLNMFLKFFRLLSDKDIFERFYKNHLTKRLLTKPNLEIERKMISKFKTECGFVYTTQLEKMLTDIDISSHHMDIFHGEIIESSQSLAGIDFNVVVLNQGLWPIPSFPSCNLPAAPSVLLELYKTFYNDKHNGRKLKLQSNFGNALVEFNLKNNVQNEKMKLRSVFFDVSTLQMIILTLFNDRESISIEEICHLTNIPEKNVIASLNPIVNGKSIHRILKKSGDFQFKMPLKMDTVITINDNFNSKISRIKIPFSSIQIDENSDRKLIQEKTELERGLEIDAAVVRIMKNRKKLPHRELVAETITALTRFKANVKSIDNRILRLIEKEYIEKINENGSDVYVYIA